MKSTYSLLTFLLLFTIADAQSQAPPKSCSTDELIARQAQTNPHYRQEIEENEAFIQDYIRQLKSGKTQKTNSLYTIPVVIHVFHDDTVGMVDMAQIQSGMDILNADFNGLNADWSTIDPRFDSIKASLDIQFCLATIDPNGNPTTGVNYYNDSLKMLNIGNLFVHAWDNYKYLNIYMPKYTNGSPSMFTAYAYYPSTSNSNNNTDGIFYSSIRWGYGTHSELAPGQEWASVVTHEAGHWLNLRHTFENECFAPGDFVADTPPTEGGVIYLSGCNNFDSTCGVPTNGENYMNYNHDCKKMFTQGQVDRMLAALALPSRSPLWSQANLQATGCVPPVVGLEAEGIEAFSVSVYPNPAKDDIQFKLAQFPAELRFFDARGQLVFEGTIHDPLFTLDTRSFHNGLYVYECTWNGTRKSGKVILR